MKLFGGLLKSSREIIIVTLLQYVILILLVLLFGKNKTIFLGTIILNIFVIIANISGLKSSASVAMYIPKYWKKLFQGFIICCIF